MQAASTEARVVRSRNAKMINNLPIQSSLNIPSKCPREFQVPASLLPQQQYQIRQECIGVSNIFPVTFLPLNIY